MGGDTWTPLIPQCELHHGQPARTTTSGEYLGGAANDHTVSDNSSVHRETVLFWGGLVVNEMTGEAPARTEMSGVQPSLYS